jgi:hypothetical protein
MKRDAASGRRDISLMCVSAIIGRWDVCFGHHRPLANRAAPSPAMRPKVTPATRPVPLP